jgi:hypothetical protein
MMNKLANAVSDKVNILRLGFIADQLIAKLEKCAMAKDVERA